MTGTDTEDLARALDTVLADMLPIETLLDAATRGGLPPTERLDALESLGLRALALSTSDGGFDLDGRSLAMLGWVAGRRLMPVALRNEALLVAPILASVRTDTGSSDPLRAFLEAGLVVASGVHPTRTRGEASDRATFWTRPMPSLAVLGSDDGRAIIFDVEQSQVTPTDGIDPGQGHTLIGLPTSIDWLASTEISAAMRRWHLFVFAELLGVCEHVTRMTIEYASNRFQFGRPIASFQAVRHMIADMYVGTELTRSAVSQLCVEIDMHSTSESALSFASTLPAIARDVCEHAIQVHGGMGFTWEYGLHLYYRRALAIQAALGGQTSSERAVGLRLLNDRGTP